MFAVSHGWMVGEGVIHWAWGETVLTVPCRRTLHDWFLRQEQSSWRGCWRRQHPQRLRSSKCQSSVFGIPEPSPLLRSSRQRGLLKLGDISGGKTGQVHVLLASCDHVWMCVRSVFMCVCVNTYLCVNLAGQFFQNTQICLKKIFFLPALVPYMCCLL